MRMHWTNGKTYKSMKSICYQNNSKIYYLSDEAFKTISDTGNSQGIIAVVDDKKLEVENKTRILCIGRQSSRSWKHGYYNKKCTCIRSIGVNNYKRYSGYIQ